MKREAFIFFSEIFGTLSLFFCSFLSSVYNYLPIWHMGQICISASHLQGGGCILLYFRARGRAEWGRDGWKFRIHPTQFLLSAAFALSCVPSNKELATNRRRSERLLISWHDAKAVKCRIIFFSWQFIATGKWVFWMKLHFTRAVLAVLKQCSSGLFCTRIKYKISSLIKSY